MKVINKTKWSTAHLRAIAVRIARVELEPEKRKRVILTFSATRGAQHYCSGYAYIHGRHARVNLPTKVDVLSDEVRLDLAQVIAHEFAHLRGISNERSMRRSLKYGRPRTPELRARQREMYAWILDMPIEPATPRVRTKPAPAAVIEAKLAAIDAKLKSWAAKRKRAETALKKYRRQRKYYERRQVAIGGAS